MSLRSTGGAAHDLPGSAASDRAAGVLAGLAAGDLIGGPVRMALQLAESLLAVGGYDSADLAQRYLRWWTSGEAFDTGPVTGRTLELVAAGAAFEDAAATFDEDYKGRTAGCNAAHRAGPLAMCAAIDDAELAACAIASARLTHAHPLAGEAAAAVAMLCRGLVHGRSWDDARRLAAKGRAAPIAEALDGAGRTLDDGGFAPDVLRAAVHFVGSASSFPAALRESIAFAGAANYSPVLVGAIGGARWGRSAVDAAAVAHHRDLVPRLMDVATRLSRW